MNGDVEDLLREGMERFTADLRAPAGLMRRAVRRRRRRLALQSAAAAVLAAGVAVAAVMVPGARGGTDLTAYVVKRVDKVLGTAEPGQIAQMTVTTTKPAATGGADVAATAEEWSYRGRWRLVTYLAAGQPVYDEGFSSSSVYTLVSYQTRTWARQPWLSSPAASASGPYGCGPAAPTAPRPQPRATAVVAGPLLFRYGLPGTGVSAGSLPATVASALRTAVSCGTLAVAGRQRVDGIEAIELTSSPDSLISETIWVSPGTYLPVRAVVRSAPGQPFFRQTADITWLPPTAQNLARLTVPIPAGFRKVPLVQAVTPITLQPPTGQSKPRVLCPSPAGQASKDPAGASGSGRRHITLVLPVVPLPVSGRRSLSEAC